MKTAARTSLLAILAAAIAAAPSARSAELAILHNGFEQRCHHHATVGDRVRLYLNTGEDNFIEYAPAEIERFDPAPDPQKLQDKPSVPASAPDASLSRADIGEILSRASHERNVDVDLLASIVKAESGGNTRAVSRTGARGLMQLMPATAANLGVHDSFHPEQNVRGGSTYIDSLLVRYHDNLALALAAYNAGPAAVDKYHGIPPYRETRAYVARVIHEFNRRALARQAQTRTASSSPPQR
jgi:soluble lytic murein transglycosylase-like protein